MSRARRWGPAILLALPFALRLIYFLQTRSQPYFQWSFLVAYVNETFAADLARGAGAPYALYRSPYYPLLVSWIYRLVGIEPAAIRLVQWILGGVGCLLVYRIGLALLDQRRALIALVIASVFAPSIYYEGELLEQSLAGFFVLAGVAVIAASAPASKTSATSRGAWRALAGALLYGAGFLLRPDLILAAPFLACAVWLGAAPAGRWRRLAAFGAGSVLMVFLLAVPHILINVRENDTRVNAAINLYLGNNPGADGHDARFEDVAELPTTDPAARADHMTGLDLAGVRYAMRQTGGGIATVAPYWTRRALHFVASDPIAWARLIGAKALLFCNGYLAGTQKDIYFLRESSSVLAALIWCAGICVPLGLIFPLAGLGIARADDGTAPRRFTTMLLVSVPLGCLATTLLFFHDARFQQPAWPFLILLAASGLAGLIDAMRARRWRPMVLLAALLILCNADWLGTHMMSRASEEFRVGTMYLEAGDMTQAGAAFTRSLLADPAFVPSAENLVVVATAGGSPGPAIAFLEDLSRAGRATAVTSRALARLHLAAGDTEAALATLREATSRFPDDDDLRLDLSGLMMQSGALDESLALARRSIEQRSLQPRARAYAGSCLLGLGRPDEAVTMLQDGLARAPDDPTLLGLLGQAYGELGRRDDEQRSYRRILAIDPGHAEAAYRLALSLAAEGKYDEALTWAGRAARAGHPGAAALARDLESRARR